MQAKRLIALDFDGVICDSCGESSLSALKAATRKWPEVFGSDAVKAREQELLDKMRQVRPVVETGYENIVQIRCLLEGVSPEDMLDNWHEMLPAYMKKWSLDRSELVHLFGSVRDEWIHEDLKGWLAPNRIYDGVAEPLAAALRAHEAYIVTTKQAHYTEILLRDMARVDFPPSRIFSQTLSGRPKTEVLQQLGSQHPEASQHIFIEDKLGTLEKVEADPALAHWQLYLVDWGYNTAKERQKASEHPRISVIDVSHFTHLLTGE